MLLAKGESTGRFSAVGGCFSIDNKQTSDTDAIVFGEEWVTSGYAMQHVCVKLQK